MNPIPFYIAMDVETGGLKQHNPSLLTAYFKVLDASFNKIADLSLMIKPDDGVYRVTGQALGVNKINLVEHDAKAVVQKDAGTTLYQFLDEVTNGGRNKLTPLGHNVAFDIDFVTKTLVTENTWLKFVSYRLRDTGIIGGFLKDTGFIPENISGSLSSYAEFFNISTEGAHTAEKDVDMSVEIYQGMLNLVSHGNGDY